MEAKELRIGNWVNIGLKSSDLRTDYDAITSSGLMDLQVNKERSSFIYEPIPLTEEWLVKFGLNDKYYFAGGLRLIKDEEEGYYLSSELRCGFDLPTIKHVHQLQNLYFALTNEELTIK